MKISKHQPAPFSAPVKIITATLLVFATTCLAHARLHKSWSYQELYDQADLVIIAKPISTQDTAEKAILPNIAPDVHVVGLSTEFEISVVMKGDKGKKKATLHHYRLTNPNELLANGPGLVSFDPKPPSTTTIKQGGVVTVINQQWPAARFLLFLQLESDGRYSPVSGQTDPDISVLWLHGSAR